MSTSPRVLRPTESPQQRLAALRTELASIETDTTPADAPPPDAPAETPPVADFAAELEREIRTLLALGYQLLPPQQRHYLIRAGVALWAAKNAKGPVWGTELDAEGGGA